MDMLEKIDKLNKKIDTLMRERDRIEAQKEVYGEKLNNSLEKYREEYGVDLLGINFEATKENIKNEFNAVNEKVTKEYELAQRVVSAIDSGDIDLANSLVGVSAPPNFSDMADDMLADTDSDMEDAPDFPDTAYDFIGDTSEIIVDDISDGFIGDTSEDIVDDISDGFMDDTPDGFMDDTSEYVVPETTSNGVDLDAFVGSNPEPVSKPKLKGAKLGGFLFEDDDEEDAPPTVLEDDGDELGGMDFDDLGFGEMLKGSKFNL